MRGLAISSGAGVWVSVWGASREFMLREISAWLRSYHHLNTVARTTADRPAKKNALALMDMAG